MYFTDGSSRAFEILMRGKPSFDRYENGGCADCGLQYLSLLPPALEVSILRVCGVSV